MRFKQLAILAAILTISAATVTACHDGRPGFPSDRHHRDRDHGHDHHD
jgi:hypothetical protein